MTSPNTIEWTGQSGKAIKAGAGLKSAHRIAGGKHGVYRKMTAEALKTSYDLLVKLAVKHNDKNIFWAADNLYNQALCLQAALRTQQAIDDLAGEVAR